jgi:hypothetical protein
MTPEPTEEQMLDAGHAWAQVKRLRLDLDAARERIAELEAVVEAYREAGAKAESTAAARIEELENACRSGLEGLEAGDRLIERARNIEAMHLARIADLEQQLDGGLILPFSELAKLSDYDDEAPATAHYDVEDEKPASTEGWHTDNEMSDSHIPRGKVRGDVEGEGDK